MFEVVTFMIIYTPTDALKKKLFNSLGRKLLLHWDIFILMELFIETLNQKMYCLMKMDSFILQVIF